MFPAIFTYELKYWLKNASTYIYGLSAFLFGLVTMAGNAGVFGNASEDSVRMANSPMALYNLTNLFTKPALFILPAIVGHSVYRDFKSRADHILFSFPVSKSDYLSGKFLSAFLVVVVIAIFFLTGCFSGTMLPGADEDLITVSGFNVYSKLFLLFLLPNLFLFSTGAFCLALFTRSVYVCFIAMVIIIILREILLRLTAGADVNTIAILLEPFGERATHFYTGTWSVFEQNVRGIPIGKYMLLNRMIWILISCVLILLCLYKFHFSQDPVRWNSMLRRPAEKAGKVVGSLKIEIPVVNYNYSFTGNMKRAWLLSVNEYPGIIRTGAFISIVLAGSLFVYVLLSQMNAPYGVRILPVTWYMLGYPVLFFSLLIHFVTFLYAGVLVHRAGTFRMMQLVDATPVTNWVLALSRLFILVKLQATLLFIIFCVGVVVQITNGYYRIEITHYLFDLFGIHWIGFVIWGFLALLVQTVFTNVWLGLFMLVLLFFGISELPLLGIEKYVFRFNQHPDPGFYMQYSDLSGYSHSLKPYFIYKAYWFFCGLFLFCLTLHFWQRGIAGSPIERFKHAMERFRNQITVPTLSFFFLFVIMGFGIHQLERDPGKPLTPIQKEKLYEDADRKFLQYQYMVQPRIIAVEVTIDIYPENQRFSSSGKYSLINKSGSGIDTLLVTNSPDVLTELEIDNPVSVILSDKYAGITMLKLHNSMKPGDTIILGYHVKSFANTFLNKNPQVEKNGTYITSLIYPRIGYRPRSITARPEDTIALQNHYRSSDADFIDFTATVSTTRSQMAVAPGYLKNHWVENNRNYFLYQSDSPVTNDYAFLSGTYIITRDKWKDIDIEIYHHKEHVANTGHMIKGIKATLEYCEANFSKYQHKQIRIIEYSRSTGDFAQSFANTIPYSEIGFILDINEKGERGLNLPFLGASHELAHQWWGMQVIPADVNGAKMVTESMAEYVSLKVFEKEYSKAKTLEFLDKSMKTYITKGIGDETEELPLIYNTGNDRPHIPYQKGMLALNTLSHHLGEETLNSALKKYLDRVYQQRPPYTTSLEMVHFIREVTPDSLTYLIHDLFGDVIVYDNHISMVSIKELKDRQFEVELLFDVKKYRKGRTKESEINLSGDIVEIGFYGVSSDKLPGEVKRIRVGKSKNRMKYILGFRPAKITIDPYLLMIDKNRKDNTIQF